MFWENYACLYFSHILPFIDFDKNYCSSLIARAFSPYKDKSRSKEEFDNLKRIWDKRDIVVIEGENTRLGADNDLLSNAESVRRIICPSVNAYSKIKDIKDFVIKNIDRNIMLIGVLGPTASILALEFCEEGYQFIDIGQINTEYNEYLSYIGKNMHRGGYSESIICKIL